MRDQAKQNVAAFHTWHRDRTWEAGHRQIDPWMRNVLVSLQSTLNLMAQQLDENSDRIEELETKLRHSRR